MIGDWESFFVAQAGAAAALAGLVFVALSINLAQILDQPGLPGRAAEAISLMVTPVFTALVALIPGQSLREVGIELFVVALLAFALVTSLVYSALSVTLKRPRRELMTRPLAVLSVVPALVGGVLLITGSDSGFYWLALSTFMCLATGITDAWVLLVEILR